MKTSRDNTLKIHYILDQILPPFVRDSKWFMKFIFKLIFKEQASVFLEFKNKAPKMTQKEYLKTYEIVKSFVPQRDTDLNNKCVEEIIKKTVGRKVLEVGCGKCYLADKLSKKQDVTASDMIIGEEVRRKFPNITFQVANIEKLPFKDKEFDTVVCAQTLEHVQNIFDSIKELRRVTKKRLIIVVPMQRPYKYTFDLHLHFFPYPHSLMNLMGNCTILDNSCKEIEGDLFYIENYKLK